MIAPSVDANARGLLDAAKGTRDLKQAQQDAAITVAEAGVQFDLQAGRISKTAAAVQIATLHTIAYEQALARLSDQKAAVLDGPEANAQRLGFDKQIEALNSQRAVQVYQDQSATHTDGLAEAFRRVNEEIIDGAEQTAPRFANVYANAIQGINGSIVNALTGDKSGIGDVLKGISKQTLSLGLGQLESTALKSLGLGGKPDGSRSNPLSVNVLNGLGGVALGGTSNADGVAKNVVSKALGFIPGGNFVASLFGGGKAIGGPVNAGTTYLVGENGPELFSPGASGVITPNNKLQDAFGKPSPMTVHVDARGATDPAAVEMAAKRAVAQAAPHIIAASLKAGKNDRSRTPGSRA